MKRSKFMSVPFKKTYLQIAVMLMTSTFIVLVLMALVYARLHTQLDRDGETNLRSETSEVEELVQDGGFNSSPATDTALSDDRGQNMYFLVMKSHSVVFQSSPAPIPATALTTIGSHGVSVFESRQKPYRLLQYTWHHHNQVYEVYIYQQITQEYEMLRHVRNLMIIAGSLGIAFTVCVNLWIAYRALVPARRTWQTHQDMMLELSHELQTPLATIQAVVSSDQVDARTRNSILPAVNYASNMVKDILYLANLETRVREHANEAVAVSDLTEEVVERFQDLSAASNIRLQGRAVSGLYVNTTSDRWSRLVSTIFKNVIDHAAPGTIARWSLTTHGHRVALVVTNEMKHPYQAAPGFKRGIGLMIANRLVQDMDGTIEVVQVENSVQTTIYVPWLKGRSV